MANSYSVIRELGAGGLHHNNKWSVYKTPAHSDSGSSIFTAAGSKAKERAEHVAGMFRRERSPDDERFLQQLLGGDRQADAKLRKIVGANPRSRSS